MPAVFCLFWHGRDTLLGTSFNYLRRYRRGQGVNRSKFDRLFAEGREALLSGLYRMESAPVDGVARWGIGAGSGQIPSLRRLSSKWPWPWRALNEPQSGQTGSW